MMKNKLSILTLVFLAVVGGGGLKADNLPSGSKSGGFIGIEGNLNFVSLSLKNSLHSETSSFTKENSTDSLKNAPVFGIGLTGGYQYYFDKSQGIKASAHIYSGYAKWDFLASYEDDSDTADPYTIFMDQNVSFVPIQSGLDIQYLWDFFQINQHTLGLSVGVGYEFDYYVSNKVKSKNTQIHSKHPERNGTQNSEAKLDKDFDFFVHHFYPVIGLHYYYEHHQFEVLYRFGGVVIAKGKKTFRGDFFVDDVRDGYVDTTISAKSNNYFTFNYTYRF